MKHMNIEDYLVSEGIGTEVKIGFLDLLRGRLSEEKYLENEKLYEESHTHPSKTIKLVPKMYDFMAKHGVFTEFWQVNLGHMINNTQFITENIAGQKRILDIGCADGLKTIYYALSFPGAHFVGIDRCTAAISIAQKKAEKHSLGNICFVPANLYHLGFKPESFDSIIATQVLHEDYAVYSTCHGLDQKYLFDKQIKSLSEALAPKGKLLVTLLVNDIEQIKFEIEQAAVSAGLKSKKTSVNQYENGKNMITALNFVLQK